MSHIAMIEDEHDFVCDCGKETTLGEAARHFHQKHFYIRTEYYVVCWCHYCGNLESVRVDYEGYDLIHDLYALFKNQAGRKRYLILPEPQDELAARVICSNKKRYIQIRTP